MEEEIDQICERVVTKIKQVSQNSTSKDISKLGNQVFRGFEMKSNLQGSNGILSHRLNSLPVKAPSKPSQLKLTPIKPAELSSSVKRDIQIIQMRNFLDPKRFYKNPEKGLESRVLHVGTVIEGFGEFKSSRLTNKQRKATILDEILADKKIKDYTKKTYLNIQEKKANKRKVYKSSKRKLK